jgi:flagellar secretion chaperone FliS
MNATARSAYLGNTVNTASPERLLIMLFERLALDVQRAIDCQEIGDHLGAGPHLLHAQDIVLELRSSLRQGIWDGSEQLAAIYSWLHLELIKANTSRDVSVTKDCQRIIDPLVDTWREAAAVAAVAAG